MGCCHSSPRRTERRSPAQAHEGAGASDVRAAPPFNDSHRGQLRPAAPSSTSSDSLRQPATLGAFATTTSQIPSSSSVLRPNQPVRPPSPVAKSPKNVSNQAPPWTRRHLELERQAFFDTRVAGQPEVWSALQLVCELLRGGETVQAQGILDAANLTCPNGRLARGRGRDRQKGGVYDERGELYDLPDWVVADPRDVVEDADDVHGEEKDADGGAEEDESEEEPLKVVQRKETKGKGRAADVGEELRVRCRLSSSARDVEIVLGTREAVGILLGRLKEQIGDRRVKLVYLGRPLDVSRTLDAQGWQNGHTVNVLVLE